MTLDFLAMGVAGFGWGALSDRFGPRIVVLTGAVLLGLGLVLASRATTLLAFQLIYGVLVGARRRRLLRADDRGRRPAGSRPIAASRSRWSRPAWAWRR